MYKSLFMVLIKQTLGDLMWLNIESTIPNF